MHVCHRAPAVQRGVRCWPSTGAACLQRSLASSFRLPIAAMASSAGHYAIPTDLSGFMKRIEENNKGAEQVSSLVPFKVGGKEVGAMKRDGLLKQLVRFPDVFHVQLPAEGGSGVVEVKETFATPEQRTTAVAGVLRQLRDEGHLTGWREELYPVSRSFEDEPAMLIERVAAPHFGIPAYGVHINGYVEDPKDGSIKIWIARRSKTKPNWPGMLDHVVAGGQPHGISPKENVIKECEEEAGIPRELAETAKAVGVVSYLTVSEAGLKPDVLFVYDIRLPADFVPKPQDGEVEEFMLWPVEKVAHMVATTNEFKPNVNLVLIDFLVRHGFITPEHPGYLTLLHTMRSSGRLVAG